MFSKIFSLAVSEREKRLERNLHLEFSRVKLEIYVPEADLGCLREALNELGACRHGHLAAASRRGAVRRDGWGALPGRGVQNGSGLPAGAGSAGGGSGPEVASL